MTIDYLMAVWLQPLLRERGCDDVLYEQGGIVTECPRSNFFLVTRDYRLVTPVRNILQGFIRERKGCKGSRPAEISRNLAGEILRRVCDCLRSPMELAESKRATSMEIY